MLVYCTFSLVNPNNVFGFIHVNPAGSQEDPELLISAVLKPKVGVDKAKLHKLSIQTDTESVKA